MRSDRSHVMMDWPDLAGERAGGTLCRANYVVNDNATEYPALTVSWQVLGAADDVLAAGCIPWAAPSSSQREVGLVSWRIPSAVGSYRVSLTLVRQRR